MNRSIHRLRRWVVTAIAATTLLSTGVILSTSGTASAVGAETGSITALSAPTVFHGILDQPVGSLRVSLGPLDEVVAGDTITLTVADSSNTTGRIDWNGVPTITVDNVLGDTPPCIEGQACDPTGTAPAIVGGDELVITLFGDSTGTTIPPGGMPHAQTIELTNIHYDVGPHAGVPVLGTPTSGPVSVTGAYAGANPFTFVPPYTSSSGNTASNAVVSTSLAAPTILLNAVSTPGLAIGANNQTAGNWNLLLHSPGPGAEISAGDTVNIVIADNAGNNCDPGTLANPDSVGFASVPSLSITAGVGVATGTPTATASVSAVNDPFGPGIIHCAGSGVNDMLTITFTNATPVVLTTSATLGITIEITNVKYNVSSGAKIIADQGNVDVASIYDLNSVTTLPGGFSHVGVGGGGPSNGDIGGITVIGNTPPADIQLNVTTAVPGGEAVNQPISPITITENFPGALPSGVSGFVCVSLITGGEWDASSTAPTAAATNGMTVSSPNVETSGPFAGDNTLEFQVTGGSTTGPATVTLSNLDVSVSQSLFTDIANGLVLVTYGGTDAACAGGITTTTATKAFSVTGRIFGSNADATAAQAFEIANPVGGGGNLDAVVATDTDPYDALSASYVAGQTGTGVLLTPTAAISSETLNALRIEGVETVYTMGGPLAISSAAIAQLEATPSYFPGGTTERFNAFVNTTRLLTVIPIFGSTADGTASQAAQFVGNNPLGQPEFQAGYGGAYNDTTGSSGSSATSAPDLGVNTAIIATDTGFQDAASASVMADHNSLPLILSPPSALSTDAIAALDNDGIQQAIVMGGPLVINDSVVTQLEGMGISVLRIAGTDATDTSAEAAKFELTGTVASGQNAGLGYSTSGALGLPTIIGVNLQSLSFARGDFYSDAIVSSQINSILQSPELLSENPTTLGTPVATFLGLEGNPATAFGSNQPFGPGGSSTNQFNIVGGQAVFGGPVAFASALETTINTDIGPDQIPFP